MSVKVSGNLPRIPHAPSTTHRPLVLAAVMAANFMVAIEATIVSTAMPQIVGQLGGLPLYRLGVRGIPAVADGDNRGVRQAC